MADTKNTDKTKAAGDASAAEALADDESTITVVEPKVEPRPVDPFANDTTDGKDGPGIHETYTVYDPTDDRPRLEDGPRTAPPLDAIDPDTGEADIEVK